MKHSFIVFIFILSLFSCSKVDAESLVLENQSSNIFYFGADLSYINEMEDCGAIYKDSNGNFKDPYKIFAEAGTNLVRIRLWHNPTWTNYSNINDVKKSIQRAKSEGMRCFIRFSLLRFLGRSLLIKKYLQLGCLK